MAYSLSPWLKPRFFITGTNRPLAGGLMYTYKAGTTENATTYSDDSGTPNTNPIHLDSDGQCDLFLDDAVSYRIILKNSAGVTQFDKDRIASLGSTQVQSFNSIAALRLRSGTTIANAAKTLGYYSAGDGGGNSFYWDGTSTATDNAGTVIKPTTVSGAGRWLATDPKYFNIKQFGAVGNGISTDTSAIQATINACMTATTNPTGTTGNRGCGAIHIPKGKYLTGTLTVGTQVSTRPFGVVFYGDGEYASSLLYSSNSGNVFSFVSYSNVTFRDLSIIHTDVTNIQANRGSWSNICFNLDGTGGGRVFALHNVTTFGFDKVFSLVGSGNNDTNFCTECTFSDGNTFMYCVNPNAVINRYQGCTWGTEWNYVFNLSGFGHTTLQNCNIVVSGSVLYLPEVGSSDSIQNSRYVLDNCKLEFWAAYGAASNATTKLIDAPSKYTAGSVTLRNTTLAGGKTPDASIYQINIGSADLFFRAYDCFLSPSIKILIGSGGNIDKNFNAFYNCDSVPPVANITYSTPLSSEGNLPIVYKRNRGVNDVTVINRCTWGVDSNHDAAFSVQGAFASLISGSTTQNKDYLFYGLATLIDDINVFVKSKVALTSSTVYAYSDSGRTALIGSVALTNGTSTTPECYTITVPANTVLTTGIYFSVTNTNANGGASGHISIKYRNF